MQKRLKQRRPAGTQAAQSHILDLFDDVWPVDRVVLSRGLDMPTQQFGLAFAPQQDVFVVGIAHSRIMADVRAKLHGTFPLYYLDAIRRSDEFPVPAANPRPSRRKTFDQLA